MAVQSEFLNVHAVALWVEADVGAVQSFARLAYGGQGLELGKESTSVWRAIEILLDDDPAPDGCVDTAFQQALADYIGRENYRLRIDEVTRMDPSAGEALRLDREVLDNMRAVFHESRYR